MQQGGGGVGRGDGGRSKGFLLPVVGLGAAGYFVSGLVSLSTLGLLGIGVGVGYGVGTWAADAYYHGNWVDGSDSVEEPNRSSPTRRWRRGRSASGCSELWPLTAVEDGALQRWQVFLTSRAALQDRISLGAVQHHLAEFEKLEPVHAALLRSLMERSGPAAAREILSSAPGVVVTDTAPADV